MTTIGPIDFLGGWNTAAGPYDIPPNALIDGQNMELIHGRLQKKTGNGLWTTNAFPSAGALIGLGNFHGNLVATNGSDVAYVSNSSAGTWTTITGTATLGYTNNAWMDILNNILVIGGENGTPAQWTGSGNVSNLSAAPVGCIAGCVANNYLFMANGYHGNVANPPYRMFWSAVEDPTTWPGANFVDVIMGDGSTQNIGIQALAPFGEDVLIFRNDAIARFYTNQTSGSLGPLVMVTEKFGCAGPACVDRLPDGRIAFIGYNNHVYIYDGNTFDDISDAPSPRSNIQETLNALAFQTSGFNQGFCKVYQAKNQIWCSYPFSFTSALGTTFSAGVIFIYDYVEGCWIPPYVDHKVYKAVNYLTSNKQYFITSGNLRLYQEDNGYVNNDINAASTSMDAFFTKSIRFADESHNFVPRSAIFPMSCGNLSFTVYWGSNGFINPGFSKSYNLTQSNSEIKKVVPITSGNTLWNTGQFRVDGNLSNQPFVVSPFWLSDEMASQV